MEDFDTIRSFTLGVEHAFSDPSYVIRTSTPSAYLTSYSIGDPPYDQVINFGRVILNSDNFPCTEDGDSTTCKQNVDMIKAPIYATIAKKR